MFESAEFLNIIAFRVNSRIHIRFHEWTYDPRFSHHGRRGRNRCAGRLYCAQKRPGYGCRHDARSACRQADDDYGNRIAARVGPYFLGGRRSDVFARPRDDRGKLLLPFSRKEDGAFQLGGEADNGAAVFGDYADFLRDAVCAFVSVAGYRIFVRYFYYVHSYVQSD